MEMPQTNAADEPPAKPNLVKSALSALARAFNNPHKEAEMDKNTLVQQLVANERCPLAQNALEKLSLEELQPLADALKEAPQVNQQAAPADLAKTIADAVNAAVAPLTQKVDGLIANQKTAEETEKATLIAALTANEAVRFPETALQKLDVAELRALQAEFTPADYSGRGGLRVHSALSGDLIPADELEA